MKQVGFIKEFSIQSFNESKKKVENIIFEKGKAYEVQDEFFWWLQTNHAENTLNLNFSEIFITAVYVCHHYHEL